MSLFEDPEFQWRETYFILFAESQRPQAAVVREALQRLDTRYQLSELRDDGEGHFESVTLKSPDDYAAMDISYMDGEEVAEQVQELLANVRRDKKSEPVFDDQQLARLKSSTARLDVLHFEHISAADIGEDEEEFLDPGSLLVVLERLKQICQGVVIDPQSGCAM